MFSKKILKNPLPCSRQAGTAKGRAGSVVEYDMEMLTDFFRCPYGTGCFGIFGFPAMNHRAIGSNPYGIFFK